MDWLSVNQDKILCYEKHNCILLVEGSYVIIRRLKSCGPIPIISMMKAHKCRSRGCGVFLAYEIESSRKTVDPVGVEVVREFNDVFPNKLPRLPLLCEVEF